MQNETLDVPQEGQANLMREKQEWEQTFDAVSDLVYIVDRDHTIVRANRAMTDRCGQLVGRKCYEVIHNLPVCLDNCPHARILEMQEPQRVEFEIQRLHEIFEVSISPVLNPEGQVTASVHVARDVTEKHNIEQALQESEQRFAVFMEHLPLAVTIKDSSGTCLFANEYLKDLFHVENMIGMSAGDLLSPDVALKMAQDDQEALTQGLGLYKDVISEKDGNELVFDTYKFPIPLANGTTLLGSISVDVTEKKRHEKLLAAQQQQLEEMNRMLESRIEAAVAELRKKDDILIQQSRLNAMGEMISNIAHQWRQPLNNIGLIVQGLQLAYKAHDLTIEELDEDVADTMKVLQQISETIDDFRNFFCYEGEISTFLVNELITRSLSLVEPSLKSKGIRIELEEPAEVFAEGYPNEYVQAFLNIMLNARDALVEHHVDQSLITIRIFEENGRSIVTVRDNGSGIREDVLPKIFDPYFSTKQQGNGAGIGLYMAKMIIEKKMHGLLSARNVEGGAEFRIEV